MVNCCVGKKIIVALAFLIVGVDCTNEISISKTFHDEVMKIHTRWFYSVYSISTLTFQKFNGKIQVGSQMKTRPI